MSSCAIPGKKQTTTPPPTVAAELTAVKKATAAHAAATRRTEQQRATLAKLKGELADADLTQDARDRFASGSWPR